MKKNKQKNMKHANLSQVKKGSHLLQVVIAVIIVAIFGFIVYGAYCASQKTCTTPSVRDLLVTTVTITLPRGTVKAEVVDTPSSRELGLSGRKGLGEGKGMLFVFDKPGKYGFWMKDMLFAIDILWINEDGLIVHVERNVKPESYPKAFINTLEATYVLELPAGASEKYGLFIGAKAEIGQF